MRVGAVYLDTWRVYRLLFRRSVPAAALVYAFVDLLEGISGTGKLAAIAAFVATWSGPVFVQGALVEIVRNVHEGRRPATVRQLFSKANSRFWRLVGASITYGLGVGFGWLLIVPGFLAAARWSLMAPGVMLENDGVFEALDRSRRLVRGQTGRVFVILTLSWLLDVVPPAASFASGWDRPWQLLFNFAWSAVVVPFQAHLLSVVYYRLADPLRPVIDPDVLEWPSVWRGGATV